MSVDDTSGRTCVSSDGVVLGVITGVHRDVATSVATWAVLDSGRADHRFMVVPLAGAQPAPGGIAIPATSGEVWSAPPVADPTRMTHPEEALLAAHYRLQPPAATHDRPSPSPAGAEIVRSEEVLSVSALEWRPYARARIRTVVRSENVTYQVTLRRQELVIEEEPISAVERLEVALQVVERATNEPLHLVLHREEAVLTTRVVPYERVQVTVAPRTAEWTIETQLARERVDVERTPLDQHSDEPRDTR